MTDRWTVRECPRHGPVPTGRPACPIWDEQLPEEPGSYERCDLALSEPFEVVRAVGARTTDPSTSKLAALRQMPRSGSQRAVILNAIRQAGHRGMTQHEVALACPQIGGVWKRISELKQGGHVIECGSRRDPLTQTENTVYVVPSERAYPREGPAADPTRAGDTGRTGLTTEPAVGALF